MKTRKFKNLLARSADYARERLGLQNRGWTVDASIIQREFLRKYWAIQNLRKEAK